MDNFYNTFSDLENEVSAFNPQESLAKINIGLISLRDSGSLKGISVEDDEGDMIYESLKELRSQIIRAIDLFQAHFDNSDDMKSTINSLFIEILETIIGSHEYHEKISKDTKEVANIAKRLELEKRQEFDKQKKSLIFLFAIFFAVPQLKIVEQYNLKQVTNSDELVEIILLMLRELERVSKNAHYFKLHGSDNTIGDLKRQLINQRQKFGVDNVGRTSINIFRNDRILAEILCQKSLEIHKTIEKLIAAPTTGMNLGNYRQTESGGGNLVQVEKIYMYKDAGVVFDIDDVIEIDENKEDSITGNMHAIINPIGTSNAIVIVLESFTTNRTNFITIRTAYPKY